MLIPPRLGSSTLNVAVYRLPEDTLIGVELGYRRLRL